MGNNIILETKFVADISGSFYIPSYQRGYRWSETEVVRLLDDIYQNGKKNYCLQPVVVRKKEDQYELIDGQQRLTTLYLIYKYMKNVNPFFNEPAFTLSYQTRDQSEEFLKTLDMTKQDDNIDFWFISKASVESIGGEHSELIDEMQGAINADKLERTVFESIQQKVLGLLSVSGNTEYMHSIANLALLNTADNAALNNSTFDVKRNDIIQMDKKGQYIPFCTKMVFLKYYTPSAENQLHFWGQADRIAYIKAINDVLSDYIEPIVLEKEETK